MGFLDPTDSIRSNRMVNLSFGGIRSFAGFRGLGCRSVGFLRKDGDTPKAVGLKRGEQVDR